MPHSRSATAHVKLLEHAVEKMADKQDTTNLELAEQNGYIKAIAESLKK